MPVQGLPTQGTNIFIFMFIYICIFAGKLYFTQGKNPPKTYICVGDNKKKQHYVTCLESESVHHKELILEIGKQLAAKNMSSGECKELKQQLIDEPLAAWTS